MHPVFDLLIHILVELQRILEVASQEQGCRHGAPEVPAVHGTRFCLAQLIPLMPYSVDLYHEVNRFIKLVPCPFLAQHTFDEDNEILEVLDSHVNHCFESTFDEEVLYS